MDPSSLQDLQEYWDTSLKQFTSLHAQYLLYKNLKDLVLESAASRGVSRIQEEQQQQDLGTAIPENNLIADVSKVEIEKDAYYTQAIASLKIDIEREKTRGNEVLEVLLAALRENNNQESTTTTATTTTTTSTTRYPIEKEMHASSVHLGISPDEIQRLELSFAELEQQLNEYTDASARIKELSATYDRLRERRIFIENETLLMKKAYEDTEIFLRTLENATIVQQPDTDTASRESNDDYMKLSKFLF